MNFIPHEPGNANPIRQRRLGLMRSVFFGLATGVAVATIDGLTAHTAEWYVWPPLFAVLFACADDATVPVLWTRRQRHGALMNFSGMLRDRSRQTWRQ